VTSLAEVKADKQHLKTKIMSNDLFSDMLLFLRKKICLGRFLGHHGVRESIRTGVGALSLSILQLRLGWHE
jgi:hypothetical protein